MAKKSYLISYYTIRGGHPSDETTIRLNYVSKKYVKGFVDGLKAVLPSNSQVYSEIIPN